MIGAFNARTTVPAHRANQFEAWAIEERTDGALLLEEQIDLDEDATAQQLREMFLDVLPATGTEWMVTDDADTVVMYITPAYTCDNLIEAQAAVRDAHPEQIENALAKLVNVPTAVRGERYTAEQLLGLFATAVRSARVPAVKVA